jgi:hypothetical protein
LWASSTTRHTTRRPSQMPFSRSFASTWSQWQQQRQNRSWQLRASLHGSRTNLPTYFKDNAFFLSCQEYLWCKFKELPRKKSFNKIHITFNPKWFAQWKAAYYEHAILHDFNLRTISLFETKYGPPYFWGGTSSSQQQTCLGCQKHDAAFGPQARALLLRLVAWRSNIRAGDLCM